MSTAIVVGCSAYEDPSIAALRFAHLDASLVAAALKEACGLRESDVVLLTDDAADPRMRPTRTNILRNLISPDRVQRDELVFFFFSGHGFQSAHDSAQYLLPIDCVRGALEETSLRFDSILRYLQARDPRHVLLFLDACRNNVDGGKAGPSEDVSHIDVAALCPPGMVSFCSCEPGQVSYEAEGLASGVFTAALREGLSDVGRCRTIYELDAYLTARVPQIASAHGKPTQRPYTRVEPLGVHRLEIVSDRKRNQWRATTPIGSEQRRLADRPRAALAHGPGEPIVGIDFGTSYSAVSWVDRDEHVSLIPSAGGRFLVPSLVHFLPSLDYLVGFSAREADHFNPANTIHNVKRLLGTDSAYEIEGRSITPELAASLIIRSLWRTAADTLETRSRRCVAAYPASFSLAQRNALQRAFEMADLDVTRMLAEPNVAALTLHDTAELKPGPYLIVDLGGGTFDVAIVDAGDGVYEVIAAGGSSTLGGLDYDGAISFFAETYLREHLEFPEEGLPAFLKAQIRREAERVKRELGLRPSAVLILQDIEVDNRGMHDVSIPVDRDLFRTLTRALNMEVRKTVELVLQDYQQHSYAGDGRTPSVLLAGQGTKIFTVREQLEELGLGSGYVPGFQETAVAHGLGRQAGVLSGRVKESLLLDIAQNGIGVRCKDDGQRRADGTEEQYGIIASDSRLNREVSHLIPRHTTIPTKRSDIFRIEKRGGTDAPVEFVEIRASDTEVIGQVHIPYIRNADVEISISIEADSTITAEIANFANMQRRSYQLNNLYRFGRRGLWSWKGDEELEHALRGYEVWPVRPITDPDPVPPGPISAHNAVAFIRQSDQRIAALTEDSQDLSWELIRRGMTHQLAGDARSALEDYLRVLGTSVDIYTTTAAYRVASILPMLSDRSRALNGLRGAYMRMKQRSVVRFELQEIAAVLRRAGEVALADGFEELGTQQRPGRKQ